MKSFGKVIFLGLSLGLLGPAMADDLSSQSPRAAGVAETSHHNEGGQDRSGRDWTAYVAASQGPRAAGVAETAHHNDGGQDRSGRDWTKEVIPERPANASSYSSPLRGWNAK